MHTLKFITFENYCMDTHTHWIGWLFQLDH